MSESDGKPVVERSTGPYVGNDIELARAAAIVVIPWYGNDEGEALEQIKRGDIWNDHIAVQTAFTVIKHIRKHGLPPE